MNIGIVNDALRLCLNIYNAIPPSEEWFIVNIAKTANETFTYPAIPQIPTSFGYSYDAVPRFLENESVIEATYKERWFIGIDKLSTTESIDQLTTTAKAKKYLSASENVEYYYTSSTYSSSSGPKPAGQFSVLINKSALIAFYNKYSPKPDIPSLPKFNKTSGELHFLGETVQITGKINVETMSLLVENINSRLTYKEMYEVRPNANYDVLVKGKNKTAEVHDAVDQVWDELQVKVSKNEKLKQSLVFVRKSGFGVFLDKRHITSTPQTTP